MNGTVQNSDNTIQYGKLTCAQKLTSSSEETVQAIACEGSLGGRSETTGRGGFVKKVGFKLGVKERGSYGCEE